MRMTIKIVTKDGKPFEGPSAVFDEAGGSIGRHADCTLVIPDELRRVSRLHARISVTAQGFVLHDQGSFTPVRVNGLRVGRGQDVPVCEGDLLQVGSFGLRVLHMETAWEAALGTAPPGTPLAMSPAERDRSFASTDLSPANRVAAQLAARAGGPPPASESAPRRRGGRAGPSRDAGAAPAAAPEAGPGSSAVASGTTVPGSTRAPAAGARTGAARPSASPVPRAPAEADEAGTGMATIDDRTFRARAAAKAGGPAPAGAAPLTFELLTRRLEAPADPGFDRYMPAVWEEGTLARDPGDPAQARPPGRQLVIERMNAPAADGSEGPREYLIAVRRRRRGPGDPG